MTEQERRQNISNTEPERERESETHTKPGRLQSGV
jgi:hypothetical protein